MCLSSTTNSPSHGHMCAPLLLGIPNMCAPLLLGIPTTGTVTQNFMNIKLHVILPITKVANQIILASPGFIERDSSTPGHGLKVPRRDQGH